MTEGPVAGGDETGAVVVDARGLRCPLPVVRLAQAAQGRPDGEELVVLASDPAAEHDVPAWARMRGHTYLGAEPGDAEPDGVGAAGGRTLRLRVRLGTPPTTSPAG